jgi:pyrroloquinoline quinone biosynthesis protein B
MHARLLGIAQDGGFPQPGCTCPNCTNLNLPSSSAVCLAIIDEESQSYWLIDAPPQFEQATRPLAHLTLQGIFLTHAHIGHYAGLIFLGNEARSTQNLPVYCSRQMHEFLITNEPWASLIRNQNIFIQELESYESTVLTPNLTVAQIAVPHRPDFTDTFAYFVIGPRKSLFYCPDINFWPNNDRSFRTIFELNEYLLLDATFYSRAELPDRDLSKIPHPFVVDTHIHLKEYANKTTLIHLNHSNPLLNKNSPETKATRELGFSVAETDQTFDLT